MPSPRVNDMDLPRTNDVEPEISPDVTNVISDAIAWTEWYARRMLGQGCEDAASAVNAVAYRLKGIR